MSDTQSPDTCLAPHEHMVISTNGRTIHLWLHECPSCCSLDVWTDRGREVEEISANTGDETRAPLGLMTIVQGAGHRLDTGLPPTPGSAGRAPLTTAMLIWNDQEEP